VISKEDENRQHVSFPRLSYSSWNLVPSASVYRQCYMLTRGEH